jgi:hypothetical protein
VPTGNWVSVGLQVATDELPSLGTRSAAQIRVMVAASSILTVPVGPASPSEVTVVTKVSELSEA